MQLAEGPPLQTDETSGSKRVSPVSASHERAGLLTLPFPGQAQLGLQQSQYPVVQVPVIQPGGAGAGAGAGSVGSDAGVGCCVVVVVVLLVVVVVVLLLLLLTPTLLLLLLLPPPHQAAPLFEQDMQFSSVRLHHPEDMAVPSRQVPQRSLMSPKAKQHMPPL